MQATNNTLPLLPIEYQEQFSKTSTTTATVVMEELDNCAEAVDSCFSQVPMHDSLQSVDDHSYRAFFLSDPVSDGEVAATTGCIYENAVRALNHVQSGGVDAYMTFIQDSKDKTKNLNEQMKRIAEQELEDTIIRGSPREYQTALLEIAKSRNTIIHLGTGMGKTLIALLCIRHFASSPSEDTTVPNKQTLFLVPSVALAMQQSATLRANLPYSVATACWNVANHSRLALRQADILVATHGALHDLLMHYGDLFTLRNFNLVVLDECHYALGNHQYKVIMDKWYHTLPKDQRPHILGLTASPLTHVKETHSDDYLAQMLTSLQLTLDSKLVTWNDSGNDISQNTSEDQVHYEDGPKLPDDFPSHNGLGIHKSRPRELNQLRILYQDLGPLCVYFYVESVLAEISCNSYEKETTKQFHCLLNYLQVIAEFCQKQAQQSGHDGGRSDKLIRLESLLFHQLRHREDAVGLVFVQRRITAMALYNYFQRGEFVTLPEGDCCLDASLEKSPEAQETLDCNSSHHIPDSYHEIDAESKQTQWSTVSETYGQFDDADLDSIVVFPPYSSQAPFHQGMGTSKEPLHVSSHHVDAGRFDQFCDADETDYTVEPKWSLGFSQQSQPVNEPGEFSHVLKCSSPDQFCDAYETEPDQFCDAEESEQIPQDSLCDISNHLTSTIIRSRPDQVCNPSDFDTLLQLSQKPFQDKMQDTTPKTVFCREQNPLDADEADRSGSAAHSGFEGKFIGLDYESHLVETATDALSDGTRSSIADETLRGQALGKNFDLCAGSLHKTIQLEAISFPKNPIRCGISVRRATQIFKYLNATNHVATGEAALDPDKEWLHQELQIKATLNALRKKEINVLVATSIIEEGIDVQACSFVVAFDNASSVKAYVQMKGRARQKSAKFFLFSKGLSNPKEGSPLSLRHLQMSEKRIRSFIKDLQDDEPFVISFAVSSRLLKPTPTLSSERRAVEVGEYRAEHGTVDLKSAKSLLNKYTLAIPVEPTARATRDSFLLHMPSYLDDGLMLPAHLSLDVRFVAIPLEYRSLNRRLKQQILALMACVRLHKLKLLNERLLPLSKEDLRTELMRARTGESQLPMQFTAKTQLVSALDKTNYFLYPLIQTGPTIEEVKEILKGRSKQLVLISPERISIRSDCLTFQHQQLGEIECKLGEELLTCLERKEFEACQEFFAIVFSSRWRKKTWGQWFQACESVEDEVLPPVTIGLFTAEGELDWKGMELVIKQSKRSNSELETACRSYKMMSAPRLCNPTYLEHTTYIVLGPSSLDCSAQFPSSEKCDSITFQDFFHAVHDCDVTKDETLYIAQRLWHQPSGFKSCNLGIRREACEKPMKFAHIQGINCEIEQCPKLETVLLPLSLCREAIVADPSLSLLFIVVPQLLYYLERRLLVDSFVRHCRSTFPILGKFLESLPWTNVAIALTARSANLDVDYDRYAWLGDAVLKLLQTDALLHTPKLRNWVNHLHEGELTILRASLTSNEYLATACKRMGLEKYIWGVPLARGIWKPSLLKGLSRDGNYARAAPYTQTSKAPADVMESILGLIFAHFGYNETKTVGLELRIILPHETGINLCYFAQSTASPRQHLYETAKAVIGRDHFHHHDLVEEALTHPSAVHEKVPSYQKLEWLGDAVLGVAAREWIFRSFPLLSVGHMVTLEASLVSNEVLGYQCFKTGLYKLIKHRDQSFPSKLEYYDWSIHEGGRSLWASDPPKMMADVVEALFGACHLDGGFNAGQHAVKTMLGTILKTVEKIGCNPGLLSHPITKLNHMVGHLLRIELRREDDFVRQKGLGVLLWTGNGWRRGNVDKNEYTATVQIMGLDIISVVGPSLKSARNSACSLTVVVLEKHPELLERFSEVTADIFRNKPVEQVVYEHGI